RIHERTADENKSQKPAPLLHRRNGYKNFGSVAAACGGRMAAGLLSALVLVEGFPHVDTSCSVLGCAEESPFANIYRAKRISWQCCRQGKW
ncbi:hypothetical protein FQN60_018232, partial [Etheostoma spectabile]